MVKINDRLDDLCSLPRAAEPCSHYIVLSRGYVTNALQRGDLMNCRPGPRVAQDGKVGGKGIRARLKERLKRS